eukprot:523659_1
MVMALYQYRKHMFLKKRYTLITIALSIFFTTQSITESSILFFSSGIFFTSHSFWIPIAFSMSFINYWFLIYALFCKNWMRLYHYKWAYFMEKSKWKSIIAPTNAPRNWWLRHQHNYGNFRWITKYVAMLCGVLMIVSVVTTFAAPYFVVIPVALLILLGAMPIFFVVFKTYYKNADYYFADVFCIGWESKMQLFSLMAAVLVQLVSIIPVVLLGDAATPYVAVTGNSFLSMFSITIMCYFSTIGVIKRNTLLKSSDGASRIELTQILKSKPAIKVFCGHLSREFSIELMCSYIEFHQYQCYLMEMFDIKELETVHLSEFAGDLVVSSIISDDDDLTADDGGMETGNLPMLKAKWKAYRLFNKYVRCGSAYEINVDYDLRSQVDTFFFNDNWEIFSAFENVQPKDLLLVFERCKHEMIKLMIHSLDRFQTKNDENYKMLARLVQT